MLVIPIKLNSPVYDIHYDVNYHIPSKTWYLERRGCGLEKDYVALDIDIEPTKFSRLRKVKEAIKTELKKQGNRFLNRLSLGDFRYYYATVEGSYITLCNKLIPRDSDKCLADIHYPTVSFAGNPFCSKDTEHVWLGDFMVDRQHRPKKCVQHLVSLSSSSWWVCRETEINYFVVSNRCKRRLIPGSRLGGGECTFAFKSRDGSIITAETRIKYHGLWSGEGQRRFEGDKPDGNGYRIRTVWRYISPGEWTKPYFSAEIKTFWTIDGTDFGIYKTGDYSETIAFRNELLRRTLEGFYIYGILE